MGVKRSQATDWDILSFAKLVILAWSVDRRGTMLALYWLAIGKRLRGRSVLVGIGGQAKFAYRTWIEIAERRIIARFFANQSNSLSANIEAFVLNAPADKAATQRTMDSIVSALGSNIRIHQLQGEQIDFSAFYNGGCDLEKRWLLFLSSGDEVSIHLRSAIALAIDRAPNASVVYWDIDKILAGQRCDPFIKPSAWDPILHTQADLLVSASVVRLDKTVPFSSQGGTSLDVASLRHDLASSLAESDFTHVPLILTHGSPAIIDAVFHPTTLEAMGFPEPDRWPKISIVIPTRDRVALLSECLASLTATTYPGAFDVLVVDNDSEEPETKTYLETMVARGMIYVVKAPGKFNFSSLNNFAVARTDGEFICLLNNDVTVIDADWLTSLVRVAVADNVGAVGPMLLYPDDTIQHAGVVIGVGNAAGHIQRGIKPSSRVHPTWTRATRRVSAVTAACLLVRRSDYHAVGGLNEEDFAVAFNDVDFCLKLQALGRKNVYVGDTKLYHHESKSRGSDLAAANIARFSRELERLKQRWQTETNVDPWFSPLFSKASERCVLSY